MRKPSKIGKRFGDRLVIAAGPYIGTTLQYYCKCRCGRVDLVCGSNLGRGVALKCQACANKTARHRGTLARLANARRKGLTARISPRNLHVVQTRCIACKAWDTLAARQTPTSFGKCSACRLQRPLQTDPHCCAAIARMVGRTRTAVSWYVKQHGLTAAWKFYGVTPPSPRSKEKHRV